MIGLFALAAAAFAGSGDPHIRAIPYRENVTMPLVGHLGLQTTIELQPDERIENVAIGDATQWQVTPNKRADILFVKPIGRAKPTNMVLVTNQRTYAFSLTVASPWAPTADAIWILRFTLPSPVRLMAEPRPAAPPVSADGKNTDYTMTGPAEILPETVFDDGKTTFFRWPEQVALPAIFAVNPDGTEALVNFVMRDGFAAVQQTAGRFVIRRGTSRATVSYTPGSKQRLVKPAEKG